LQAQVEAALAETGRARPVSILARRTLSSLAFARWCRRVAIGVPLLLVTLASLIGLAWYIDSRTGYSRSIALFIVWSAKHEGRRVPGLNQPARPWPSRVKLAAMGAADV